MSNIRELLKSSKYPLFLHLQDKELASDTVISTFKGADNVVFATNIADPKSITDSEAVTKIKDVEQEGISQEDLAEMAAVVDSEGNKYLLHSELAFDLIDGEAIKLNSPITGNQVTLAYAMTDADEEGDEGTKVDVDVKTTDDGEEEIMDTVATAGDGEDESEEDESEEEDSEGEEDESEEDEDGEEMDVDVSDGEDEEDEAIESVIDETDDEEDEEPAEMAVEVSMLTLVDTSKAPKLVAFNTNGTEYAVFIGDAHVGMLRNTQAAETASVLYEDSKKLYHTFKDRFSHCAKKGSFSELASLGFVPAEVSTKIKDVALRYIQEEVASKTEAVEVEKASHKVRGSKLLSLAMIGMAKGMFGKTNALVAEVATELSRAQVVNPQGTARRLIAKASVDYATQVLEQVSALEKESDAYLNGITDAVSKADFKSTGEESANNVVVSTMFGSGTERASETAGVVPPRSAAQPGENRYARLMSGIGARRNLR